MEDQQPATLVIGQRANPGFQGQHSEQTYPPLRTNVVTNYLHRPSITVGVFLVIFGLFSIAFNVVDIAVVAATFDGQYRPDPVYYRQLFYFGRVTYFLYKFPSLGYVGHGFWTGTTFIIAGGLGIGAGIKRTRCKIIAFMVLCIIAACMACVQLSLGVLGAVGASHSKRNYFDCGSSNRTSAADKWCDKIPVLISMEALLAGFAAFGFLASLLGAIICCASACAQSFTHSYEPPLVSKPAQCHHHHQCQHHQHHQQQHPYQQPQQQQRSVMQSSAPASISYSHPSQQSRHHHYYGEPPRGHPDYYTRQNNSRRFAY